MNRPNEPFVGIAIALLLTVGLYLALAATCWLGWQVIGLVLR